MEGVGYAIASLESLDEFITSFRPAETKQVMGIELRDILVELHFDVSSLYILKDYTQLALEHLEKALKLLDDSKDHSFISSIHLQTATCHNNLNQIEKAKVAYQKSAVSIRSSLFEELAKMQRPAATDIRNAQLVMPSIFDIPRLSNLKSTLIDVIERLEDCDAQIGFDFQKLRQDQAKTTITFSCEDISQKIGGEENLAGFGKPMSDTTNFVDVSGKFKIGKKRTFDQHIKTDTVCATSSI